MLKDQFFCFNIWIFCFAAIFVIQYCSFDLNNNIKCDPSLESLKKKSEIQLNRFPSTSKKLELISVNIFFLCAVNVGVMGSCDVDFWNLSFNQLISEFFNKIVQFKHCSSYLVTRLHQRVTPSFCWHQDLLVMFLYTSLNGI